MGKERHRHRDIFFDPGYGLDPYSFLAPLSSGGSSKGSVGFEVGGRAKLKKGDFVGASAFFRDFDLNANFGRETASLFSLKGEGDFSLSAKGQSESGRASARSQYHGQGVKDLFTSLFAEYKEGELGKVKSEESEETEIVKVKKSNSSLAQGYVNIEKGSIDVVGRGSVEAGSALSALKELSARIAEESKGRAQAIAQISKSVEGREIMQRLGGATANWQISGGQLNIRKQVMMLDG